MSSFSEIEPTIGSTASLQIIPQIFKENLVGLERQGITLAVQEAKCHLLMALTQSCTCKAVVEPQH